MSTLREIMTVHRITDFTVWDLRQEFKDHEAAYLWLGLEPNYDIDHPGSVVSMRAALGEAVQRGELAARNDSGNYVYYNKWGRERSMYVQYPTYYSRNALRQWAERKGQRPLFLFPEDRIGISNLKTADEQRIPDLLAAIKELGHNPVDIPRGGKQEVKDHLQKSHPGKFTSDKFETTWESAKRQGLVKMRC